MAKSFMAIKPNRREIVQLLVHRIYAMRQAQANELMGLAREIEVKQQKIVEEWTDKAIGHALSANGKVASMMKTAEKLGFERDQCNYGDGTVRITLRLNIKLDQRSYPKMPDKMKREYDQLVAESQRLSRQCVSNETVLAMLVEADPEVKAEIDAMAEIICKGIEAESAKLLEGTVDV